MTSIHNNQGAMVALVTLSSINQQLLEAQNAVSSGKSVASAADDAAIWAVTTVMETDVDGFSAIAEALSLGTATITVARNAAEKVTKLLREVKEKVVTAQGENVDRTKIQFDISELRNQVESVVRAAQFNGLNLINGDDTAAFSVLASVDRSATLVDTSVISVARQDLSLQGGAFGTTAATGFTQTTGAVLDSADDGSVSYTIAPATTGSGTFDFAIGGASFTASVASGLGGAAAFALALADAINDEDLSGVTADVNGAELIITNTNSFSDFDVSLQADGTGAAVDGTSAAAVAKTLEASSESLTFQPRAVVAGDSYRVSLSRDTDGDTVDETFDFDYVAQAGDDINDVGEALRAQIEAHRHFSDVSLALERSPSPTLQAATLRLDTSSDTTIGFAASEATGGTPSTGGLSALATLSVLSNSAASDALDDIELMLQTAINAASAFGSSERRIRVQREFVGSLADSLKLGISALADADMESASSLLKSLQVQQQLATQALSIANSAPQNLLTLFR